MVNPVHKRQGLPRLRRVVSQIIQTMRPPLPSETEHFMIARRRRKSPDTVELPHDRIPLRLHFACRHEVRHSTARLGPAIRQGTCILNIEVVHQPSRVPCIGLLRTSTMHHPDYCATSECLRRSQTGILNPKRSPAAPRGR